MKLSLLVVVFSSFIFGVVQAKTPAGSVTIPQPAADILHNAFSGYNTLTYAEGDAESNAQDTNPVVNAIAQKLRICKFASQSNEPTYTETINGTGCPINSTTTTNISNDSPASTVIKSSQSDTLLDSNLIAQLSILSANQTGTTIDSQTMTTWHAEGPGHLAITTTQNHKIIADYYQTMDGTYFRQPNGEVVYNTTHMTTNGTATLDSQKYAGSATYDAGQFYQQWTCTINQVVVDCSEWFYIFGGSPQAPGNSFGGFARIRR